MMPLAGYADRLSVRPGETIAFKVSNHTGVAVQAELVRVISADANPAGSGLQLEPVTAALGAREPPTAREVPRGSYGVVEGVAPWTSERGLTIACRVWPTRSGDRAQVLVSRGGLGLGIDAGGCPRASLLDAAGVVRETRLATPLENRRWYAVALVWDPGAKTLRVAKRRLDPGSGEEPPGEAEIEVSVPPAALGEGALLFAAGDAARPARHFNGRLEGPVLFHRALGAAELEALASGEPPAGASSQWDFALETPTDRLVDTGPAARHGRLVNTPARGMRGSRWTGREMCWRHAPDQYGAVHFHDDDIDDCHWPTAYEWKVPADTRSGTYALLLRAGDAQENVPFFVVPPKGRRSADIAVLVSTFTYTVYGNHARPEWSKDPEWKAAWQAQSKAWGGYRQNAAEHPEYGLSTYNNHGDGSGISIASWHRPMLNVRIGYLTYPYPEIRASGLRHFPADTHLSAWLEAKGLAFDVITDWELHHEGHALLADYAVVMTGSHPEYHTREMLDALEAYRDGGGRFCYLGGNGFYWKVALCPYQTGVIEIRRGEGGIRAWAAEPGEYYNQFDGEYGGLWRRNARPPQDLCGVGFTAQGNFLGSYYRKRGEAADPRVAWIFAGLEAEVFGDHGLSGHGAAGFELDRADKRLGTPAHALVVASSENHPPDAPWVLVPEEHLTHITTWPGEPLRDLVRSDILFFETPAGGAVFSTGSITFCGSLPSDGFDNDVSRLLENVVRRFLDPAPFAMPRPTT